MKFEFEEEDVKVLDGKYAQLPFERFRALLEYVEDVEARLLAAEINLREADRVGQEMETVVPENAAEHLSKLEGEQVDKVLQRLAPAELKKALNENGVSVRKLAMMTGIPYTTLYRYLQGGNVPIKAAAGIFKALRDCQRAGGKTPKWKGFGDKIQAVPLVQGHNR